jgi:hypothetical protein
MKNTNARLFQKKTKEELPRSRMTRKETKDEIPDQVRNDRKETKDEIPDQVRNDRKAVTSRRNTCQGKERAAALQNDKSSPE